VGLSPETLPDFHLWFAGLHRVDFSWPCFFRLHPLGRCVCLQRRLALIRSFTGSIAGWLILFLKERFGMDWLSGLLRFLISGCRSIVFLMSEFSSGARGCREGFVSIGWETMLKYHPTALRECGCGFKVRRMCVDKRCSSCTRKRWGKKIGLKPVTFMGSRFTGGAGDQCINHFARARRTTKDRDHRQWHVAVKRRLFIADTKQGSLFLC
tara:strand:+ start:1498 stop:2127 length:630 start_codon:yes stop_codon:yes gene_type:complete